MNNRLRFVPPKQRLATTSGVWRKASNSPLGAWTRTPSVSTPPQPHPHQTLPSVSQRIPSVNPGLKSGFTDGIRCDTDGNVWCGWGWGGVDTDGVRVHAPSGELLAFLHTPEVVANLCFGGTKRNRLFMTGSTSIYALYVNAVGAALS